MGFSIRSRDEIDVDGVLEWLRTQNVAHSLILIPGERRRLRTDVEGGVFKFGHGQSNPTYFWKSEELNRDIVIRMKPRGDLLPSAHDIHREYTVMSALQRTMVGTRASPSRLLNWRLCDGTSSDSRFRVLRSKVWQSR